MSFENSTPATIPAQIVLKVAAVNVKISVIPETEMDQADDFCRETWTIRVIAVCSVLMLGSSDVLEQLVFR